MMKLIHLRLTRLMVALVMALSMTSAAFAHRLPGGEDAALQGFILAGGNLNDLCGEGHQGPGSACPLCRMADDPLLPVPPFALPLPGGGYTTLAILAPANPPPARPAPGLPFVRGPPSV